MKWVRDRVAKGWGLVKGAWGWVRENRLLALSLGASVVVAVVVVVVAFVLGSWLTGTGPGEETGSTTVRNLGIVAAGLIALPLAVWRGKSAERQARAAELALLNEHYRQGVELLRGGQTPDRLAGIDLLRRLAEEHPKEYYVAILRLLSAFVRQPVKDERSDTGRVREDVQVIVQAISSRSLRKPDAEEELGFDFDLCGADLRGASLGGANLSKAWLTDANMAGASLSRTSLRAAVLLKANLSGTHMREADLRHADFSGADLSKAKLLNADLSMAILRVAALVGADLTGANLTGAVLRVADLTRADLVHAKMDGADLTDANLSDTWFTMKPYRVYRGVGPAGAIGLTQEQLDPAYADPDKPPRLDGVRDADTGKQLVWRGRTLDGEPHPDPPTIPDD